MEKRHDTKAREILAIGGNRYFGKRLIARLPAAGDRVTVLNRGSSPPPAGALHLVADQVCYTPRQAAIARRVFADRTRRYVMTSTVEVYEYGRPRIPSYGGPGGPCPGRG
ncbi:hypothetical protein ACQEWB_33920 [Streptomyces sp. CA-249302]|uniref:hypothetical protein n=1 Tax=Streptomyces sp. CA-249302 TaxID=3240058 RepID=UPI003D8BC6E0